ncbi:MAG: palindromic element RPE1 domain-containing protein, partial [Holosporales bacterium]|nr:palindromic element RPE1 domain-containing protein [Holosporales bacterium]
MIGTVALVVIPVLVVVSVLVFVANRYKRCPSNRILVIFGNVGGERTAKCIHGGGTFVWPLVQDYAFLSLEPMTTEIDLKGALSKKNIRVNVPSTFTFGVSTDEVLMQNAAERLLDLQRNDIITQANDIILGQLRLVLATLSIEEINQDREKFLEQINTNVNVELNKIGLEVINVNVRDITDESGYIEAIGKKAAAEAINQAKVEVAQQDKIGAVGEAEAAKSRRIQIAVFEAESIEGENSSQANIAQYDADLAVKQASALKLGEVAKANAERDVLIAQKEKEEARLKKEELAKQEVEKLKVQVMADAQAEKVKRIALGEAEAIKAKYFAEAEGIRAVLEAKSQGYQKLVAICNERPELATSLLMVEKVEGIVEKQVEAIKNIKFDKITVWDGGAGSEKGSTTANFMRDLIRALPPIHELAAQAGIGLPSVLGDVVTKTEEPKNGPLSKPSKSEFWEGDTEHRSGAYLDVREHSSTGSTSPKT